MRTGIRWSLAGCVTILTWLACAPAAQDAAPAASCRIDLRRVGLPGLGEASGLALSRRTTGALWTHNDSGKPVLVALDGNGRIRGQVAISGAQVEDWEDVAVGPCGAGSCLFIADIGDNEARRRSVAIYVVPEPAPGERATARAEVIHATYPDGPRDAEALFTAGNMLYVVTKGANSPIELYRLSTRAPAAAARLQRVGPPLAPRPSRSTDRITGASASADGAWVVLRTLDRLSFYRTADLTAGRWREAARADLRPVGEPQGEGVALGPNGTVYLAGESGGQGTFAKVTCAL